MTSITTSNQSLHEFMQHIEEIDLAMNELSELLVSSTTDVLSAQPNKLTEQLIDNAVVQNELEKRKLALEQLHLDINKLKQITTNQEDIDSLNGKIICFLLTRTLD